MAAIIGAREASLARRRRLATALIVLRMYRMGTRKGEERRHGENS
jgi:hypothetical protein